MKHNQGKKGEKSSKMKVLRQQTYVTLRDQGVSLRVAAVASGYSPNSISYLSRSLDQKRKQGLLSPLVPLAKKAVKVILKGQTVGDSERPKASDILRASEIVLDREEPKVQRVDARQVSMSMEITDEDRKLFREILGLPPLTPLEEKEAVKLIENQTE